MIFSASSFDIKQIVRILITLTSTPPSDIKYNVVVNEKRRLLSIGHKIILFINGNILDILVLVFT